MRKHPSFRCVITNRNKLLFVLEIDISVFYLKNFKCEYILDRYLQIINIMHELYSYSWDVFVLGEYVPCVLVTQSCETLCDPRLLCPWNSPGCVDRVYHQILQALCTMWERENYIQVPGLQYMKNICCPQYPEKNRLFLMRASGKSHLIRGWDSWMASLTQGTRIWTNSGRWWRTGKPGMLQSMGCQKLDRA